MDIINRGAGPRLSLTFGTGGTFRIQQVNSTRSGDPRRTNKLRFGYQLLQCQLTKLLWRLIFLLEEHETHLVLGCSDKVLMQTMEPVLSVWSHDQR